MADILSDIYPIPVSFVDGQQPTARFLNAWAAQIDVAFAVLARIIGDFDGESSEQPTYISNLVRTIGSMGWLNSRLPRGLCAGLVDGYDPDLNPDGIFPTLIETLSSGTKEAMLTFLPRDVSTTVDAGTISGWSKVNVGISTNPGSNFDAVNQWTNWSRKVYTTTTIPAGAQIQYEVDTDFGSTNAEDYYDAYSPNSGANVIPNLYEIASVVAGGGGALTTLCSYTEVVDELWIEFPDIRRAMNPALPFSTTNNILNLVDGTVHWVDGFTPRYTVPSYIFDIANAEIDDQIPEGLCSLWIAGAAQTTRLVNQNSEEQIRFFIDPADRRHVRIELPPDFVLPHVADAGLTERYIIAFASVGLADALLHERSRMIKHTHDGTGEDSLIRAVSLTERFNPSQYTQSIISHNHFPQYLLRSGYSYDSGLAVATDTLNRSNALLGPLLIGSTSATPSNTVNPSTPGTTSYSICLGSYGADSPAMYFSHADNPSGDAAYDSTGKIQLINKSVRIDQMLFLGAQSNGGWISATDGYFAFGVEGSGVTTGSFIEAGTVVSSESLFQFGDNLGSLDLTAGHFYLSLAGQPGDSILHLGTIQANDIDLSTFGASVYTSKVTIPILLKDQVTVGGNIVWGISFSPFQTIGSDKTLDTLDIASITVYFTTGGNTSYDVKVIDAATGLQVLDAWTSAPGGSASNPLSLPEGAVANPMRLTLSAEHYLMISLSDADTPATPTILPSAVTIQFNKTRGI